MCTTTKLPMYLPIFFHPPNYILSPLLFPSALIKPEGSKLLKPPAPSEPKNKKTWLRYTKTENIIKKPAIYSFRAAKTFSNHSHPFSITERPLSIELLTLTDLPEKVWLHTVCPAILTWTSSFGCVGSVVSTV